MLGSIATPAFKPRRVLFWGLAATLLAGLVYAVTTVTVDEPTGGCYFPPEGSDAATVLKTGKDQAAFPIVYPCQLPASEILTAINVTGTRGKQTATLAFDGPFDMTIRESQIPPSQNADPAGVTHTTINLFSNTKADLIERNDGSRKAEYRIVWSQGGIYYEVLADGPPLSRDQILKVARSLQ